MERIEKIVAAIVITASALLCLDSYISFKERESYRNNHATKAEKNIEVEVSKNNYKPYEEYNFNTRSLPSAEPIPEPSTYLLIGTGLLGALGYNARRKQKNPQ